MSSQIHSTSVVDPKAELGSDVVVGPYCVVKSKVRLGDRCHLHSHVVMDGPAEIGSDNEFFPFCSIGQRTQDLKYKGEPTYLEIGSHNRFREFVTIHRGSDVGSKTVIGSYNNLLAYAHVAHDCVVGSHCVFSNNGTLGGHVVMEDFSIIGGLSAVHQFCRIGKMSIIGGCAKIVQDVPPFMVADGNPAEVRAVNVVGLQRNGVSEEVQKAIRQAFKILYDRSLNTTQALKKVEQEVDLGEEIRYLINFVQKSERGIIR